MAGRSTPSSNESARSDRWNAFWTVLLRRLHLCTIIILALFLLWALACPSSSREVLIYSRGDLACHLVLAGILAILIASYRRISYRFAKPALEVGLISLITVGLLEIGVRLVDPLGISEINNQRILWRRAVEYNASPVGKTLKPNLRTNFRGWSMQTNSLGFRDEEFPIQKPPGERRLLFLGDSYVFGHGVAQDRIAAAVLERKLSSTCGPKWQVVNTGVGSYATHEQRIIVDLWAQRLDVDAVLLLYCFNDCLAGQISCLAGVDLPEYVPAAVIRDRRVRPTPHSAYEIVRSWLHRTPFVLRPRLLDFAQWWFSSRQQSPPAAIALDEDNWAWRLSRDSLLGINERCTQAGILFVVTYLELPAVQPASGFRQQVGAALSTLCDAHGIPFYELGEPLLTRGFANHVNSRIDGHPNATGQEILADVLNQVLIDTGLCTAEPAGIQADPE